MWLRLHRRTDFSRTVFIFGMQRSGTTLMVGCFRNSPEFDVYGEASGAFDDAILKSPDTVRALTEASPRPFVVFKPLKDSWRAVDLMSVGTASKAIWIYRRPEDTANSSVAEFGDNCLGFIRDLDDAAPVDSWYSRGLRSSTLAVMRNLDPPAMDACSAAGTFWYLRNQLFFDQQLDRNPNVLLLKYETFVMNPESMMKAICAFIGCDFKARMIKGVHARSVGRCPSRLSPAVAELCRGMQDKLDRSFAAQWQSMAVLRHEDDEWELLLDPEDAHPRGIDLTRQPR